MISAGLEALKSAFALHKKGKKVPAPHFERGMVRYDARSLRVEKDRGSVPPRSRVASIALHGAPAKLRRWIDCATGFATADLLRRPSVVPPGRWHQGA